MTKTKPAEGMLLSEVEGIFAARGYSQRGCTLGRFGGVGEEDALLIYRNPKQETFYGDMHRKHASDSAITKLLRVFNDPKNSTTRQGVNGAPNKIDWEKIEFDANDRVTLVHFSYDIPRVGEGSGVDWRLPSVPGGIVLGIASIFGIDAKCSGETFCLYGVANTLEELDPAIERTFAAKKCLDNVVKRAKVAGLTEQDWNLKPAYLVSGQEAKMLQEAMDNHRETLQRSGESLYHKADGIFGKKL